MSEDFLDVIYTVDILYIL